MTLDAEIRTVLAADLCTGCGLCAQLRPDIVMALDDRGFQRPLLPMAGYAPDDADAVRRFRRACPGVRVAPNPAPAPGHENPTFGPYVQAWTGWATDPDMRHAGSSGGVLTALSRWLLDTGQADGVVGAAASPTATRETARLRARDADDVRRQAGSRYAPVATLEQSVAPRDVFVGKPCEAAALRADLNGAEQPVVLSFFCAGVPSQQATDRLVRTLFDGDVPVSSLRYRGNGWPGDFAVTTRDGQHRTLPYETAWGGHLGRDLQWRCKLCVDGTGGAADIAVGDHWNSSDSGYPVFDDAPGRSIVLARTRRGHDLLIAAHEAGVITLEDVDVSAVETGQPLQVARKQTLFGRRLGTRAAGQPVPSYRGWRLWRHALRHPGANLVAARRAYGRARAGR